MVIQLIVHNTHTSDVDGVGRSSLISSLLNETYSEDVPMRFPDITIPPEISPDNVQTTIVDCSCTEISNISLNFK